MLKNIWFPAEWLKHEGSSMTFPLYYYWKYLIVSTRYFFSFGVNVIMSLTTTMAWLGLIIYWTADHPVQWIEDLNFPMSFRTKNQTCSCLHIILLKLVHVFSHFPVYPECSIRPKLPRCRLFPDVLTYSACWFFRIRKSSQPHKQQAGLVTQLFQYYHKQEVNRH